MIKGTIYKNLWAGYDAYFVYRRPKPGGTGKEAVVQGYLVHNANGPWEVRQVEYYRRDVEKDTQNFVVVGHIDIENLIIMSTLREAGHGVHR